MTNAQLNNGLTGLLVVILGIPLYFLFGESKELIKFNQTDKNTLRKIAEIKIERDATQSLIIPIQKQYHLFSKNIIEKDNTLNRLREEISELKEKILSAIKRGEDVSAHIALLNQKETELNQYIAEKSKQIQAVKDTLTSLPEKMKALQSEFESKKSIGDSLNKAYTELKKKCN